MTDLSQPEAELQQAQFAAEQNELAYEEAAAELGKLKERYCTGCKNISYCGVLHAAYEEFNDLGSGGRDFACNRWAERGTE